MYHVVGLDGLNLQSGAVSCNSQWRLPSAEQLYRVLCIHQQQELPKRSSDTYNFYIHTIVYTSLPQLSNIIFLVRDTYSKVRTSSHSLRYEPSCKHRIPQSTLPQHPPHHPPSNSATEDALLMSMTTFHVAPRATTLQNDYRMMCFRMRWHGDFHWFLC